MSAQRSSIQTRRFPPPWSVEETAPCFIVRDANGQALAFVYCEDEPGRRANDNLSSIAQSQRSGPQLPSGSTGRKSCKQSTQLHSPWRQASL